MKNTAILPLLLVLGAVSLVRSDSDCIDSYTDMTVLPGFADCNHTLSFALDSGRCGFDGNDDNVTLDLTNKMLTSIKPLVNLFECIASDRSLEVTINENFIDCVAIPSTGNYSVICDPALEKACSNFLESECKTYPTICTYKDRKCTRKSGIQKSPQVVLTINTTFTASERDAAEESLNKELKSLFVQLGIDSEKVVVKITWVLIEYRRRDDATDPDDRYRMEVTIVFPAETSSEQQASQKMAEDVVTAITSGDVSDDSVLLKKATTTYVKEEKAPDEYVNNGKTYIGSGPVIGCIVVALVLAILIVAEIVYLANYHDTKYKGKPVPSNFVNVVYVDDDESSSSSSDDDEDDDEKEGEKDKKKKKKTMEEEEEKKKGDEKEEKKEKKPVNDTKAFEQSESESESESSDESSNESDTDESNEKKKKK